MIRRLTDDTLLVFLSDCHIGGDEGRDIFESPDDLAALFDELSAHAGPVELVLAGDFFDLLRISDVPPGRNRASATIARAEYRELFAALARLASGTQRKVVYMPGNHDAEAWWNGEIRAELERAGLVHDFALSYAAAFESEPDRVVYCEHGNQFDPANTIRDYDDPLDSPLGQHVVTDVVRRLPVGWAAEGGTLRDVGRVFPLATIPEWLAGRAFYHLGTQVVRWLLLPLVVAYVAYELLHYAFADGGELDDLLVDVAFAVVLLLAVFGVALYVGARVTTRSIRSTRRFREAEGPSADEAAEIRRRLERREAPPLADDAPGEIAVFVSGHTHAPALERFGEGGVVVNSGCWLRQLQPVPARLGAPAVFVSRFVQTHVRVRRATAGLEVELWEHPRPARQQLRVAERLATLGRLPAEPAEGEAPRVRAHATAGGGAGNR